MKYLTRIEIIFPFVASFIVFLAAKNHIDTVVYLIVAIVFSFYFFPMKLIVDSKEKKWFQIVTSVLFANILILIAIYLINPELSVIKTILGMSSILCIVLLVYKHFFEKLSVRLFFLLLGFNVLASSFIIIS